MSSSQQASPVHSRVASPERQLSRERERSPPTPRRYSRSHSRSCSPPSRRGRSYSSSSSSSSSSSDEEGDGMTESTYKSMTLKGRKAYNRRVKERNLCLERTLVTMLQTLYTEVCHLFLAL